MDQQTLCTETPVRKTDPQLRSHEFRAMGSHMTALVEGAAWPVGDALA